MPLLDLSNVTRTLKSVLEQNLARPSLGGLTVTVTPLPPEKVASAQNTLSLHLYHVAEESYYTNRPGPGTDPPNVAKNPLALCLYYILTAHHESTDADLDPFTQQNLMGLAIKTFHDFPVITDRTVVNGSSTPVLHPDLVGRDNNLQIIMRPLTPEDATAFWTTEDQRTARLSAHYEVRVVMLEPEKPRTMPGIVYALGTFLVNIGSPSIGSSRSQVRFALPPSTGVSDPQTVESTPARVSTDATLPHNRLELLGTNLAIGRSRALVWRNALWAKLGSPGVTLAPGLNPSWSFLFGSDRIVVDIAPELQLDSTTTLPLFPGLYSASLHVVKDEEVVLGHLKQILDSSNEVGFFVIPRLVGHGPPGLDNRVVVTVAPTFDLTEPALDVQLIVEGRLYQRGFLAAPPSPSDNDGRFEVTTAHTVTLQPHISVATPGEHPVRLAVNGAESQPFWIVIP